MPPKKKSDQGQKGKKKGEQHVEPVEPPTEKELMLKAE
jgi:hypothetical protein